MYADDLLLLGTSAQVCQDMVDFVRTRCHALGLCINIGKTEAMLLHVRPDLRPAPLTCLDYGVPAVRRDIPWRDCARYLGLWMDWRMTLSDHMHRVEDTIRVKEAMMWRSGVLAGDRVKTSVARDFAACTIFSHAEFMATVLPVESRWPAVEDCQVRVARQLLQLPPTSSRAKTLAAIGWLPVTERLRWFRLMWFVRCRWLPIGNMWRQLVEHLTEHWRGPPVATARVGGFAVMVHRDLISIGRPDLFQQPDAVREYVRSHGTGGLSAAITSLRSLWRAAADCVMLGRVQDESTTDARWQGAILHQPAVLPVTLRKQLEPLVPRLTFQTCHDTMWCRPGQHLRAQFLTDCYPVGERLRRRQAILQQLPLEAVDPVWAACPWCAGAVPCTTRHLLVSCPSQPLKTLRDDMVRRVRCVSEPFLHPAVPPSSGLTSAVACGVLGPGPDMLGELAAEEARAAAWMRIILGGRTELPVMMAAQARSCGFHVPLTVPATRMIVAIDLASNWNDAKWPSLRYKMVKIRFNTHVVTAEYLLAVDRAYGAAMANLLQQPPAAGAE
jgi:hypothetical protein